MNYCNIFKKNNIIYVENILICDYLRNIEFYIKQNELSDFINMLKKYINRDIMCEFKLQKKDYEITLEKAGVSCDYCKKVPEFNLIIRWEANMMFIELIKSDLKMIFDKLSRYTGDIDKN